MSLVLNINLSITDFIMIYESTLSLHPSYGAAKLSRHLSRRRKTVLSWVPVSYDAAELSRRPGIF